jgi:hypothetical protein
VVVVSSKRSLFSSKCLFSSEETVR